MRLHLSLGQNRKRKVAVEDVKYLLSSHYQGTPFNPYSNQDSGKRGMYRSIGINRTGVTAVCQIRSGVPHELQGIEWLSFGSTTFAAMLPLYTNVAKMPDYISKVTLNGGYYDRQPSIPSAGGSYTYGSGKSMQAIDPAVTHLHETTGQTYSYGYQVK